MNRRRGFSLVEMLAVISGCSVVLSLTGALLVRAMRSQAETRHFLELESRACELAAQFRRDVHRARSAEVDSAVLAEQALVRIELPDGGSIEYLRDVDAVSRLELRAGRPRAREDYRLGGGVDVAVHAEDASRRLALSITPSADPAPGDAGEPPIDRASYRRAPFSLQVSAVIGRDWRFAPGASPAENPTDANRAEDVEEEP